MSTGNSKTMTKKGDQPLALKCEYADCDDVHDCMNGFLEHVEEHLNSLNPSTGDEELACAWTDCGHEPLELPDLVRHVYFHAFHAKIKCLGRNLILKNKWSVCMLDTSSHNTIPELPDQFYCAWDQCEAAFDNPHHFYEHVKTHADYYPEGNNPEGGCQCLWEGCELVQKSKHKVRTHLRSHTQEKVVACPTCGSLFSSATRFSDHIKRQQDSDVAENNFQCSYCNKRFATERILKDHMRHHVNHYKCPCCEMTCPSPSNLKMHIDYKHNNAKPHSCPEEECKYRGKTWNDVRRHMERMHIKTSLKCEVPNCLFSCRSVGEYKIHYKTAHEGPSSKRYTCHVCGERYSRGTRLTTHLKKKHRFRWLPGHNRFRFKLHEDGFYRLQTVRYESIEVTAESPGEPGDQEDCESAQDLMEQEENDIDEDIEERDMLSPGSVNSQMDVDIGSAVEHISEQTTGKNKGDLSYNLEMLGDVALQYYPKNDDSITEECLPSDMHATETGEIRLDRTALDQQVIGSIQRVITPVSLELQAAQDYTRQVEPASQNYTLVTQAGGCSVVTGGPDSEVVLADSLPPHQTLSDQPLSQHQSVSTPPHHRPHSPSCVSPDSLSYEGEFLRTSSPVPPDQQPPVVTSLVDSVGRMVYVTSNVPLTFAEAVTLESSSDGDR